ncbi:hypothetical protein ScPMuIL_015328 [Solemya velum]
MNMEGSLVILVVVVPLLTALIFIIRYYNYKNLLGFETLHLAMHSTRSSDETKPADVIQQSTNTGVSGATAPLSVNFHLTRQCNYRCGFCFHTAITSFVLPVAEAMHGLSLLADSGMRKVNFSGGEPFLVDRGNYVGKLVQFCKEELNLPSVTIVTNGSLVTEQWFQQYGEFLDILAVSWELGSRGQLEHVRDWCKEYKVAFKLNTVVNAYNKSEDMTEKVHALAPCRWKVFQCLPVVGENIGAAARRNVKEFLVTTDEFDEFLDRHRRVKCLVPESNENMRNSYLILDEYMRFLNCTSGGKEPSRSILDVGVTPAMNRSGFDEKMFFKRGGKYKWSKVDMELDW